jgi:Rha family phage regulatory protein
MPENTLPERIHLVKGADGIVRTDSLDVADRFGVPHKNVLRTIDTLISKDNLHQLKFEPMQIRVNTSNGGWREVRVMTMGKPTFCVLASKMPGERALEWSIKYVQAFDAMEKAIAQRQPTVDLNDAATLRGLLLNYSEKVLELEGEVGELKPDAEAMKMLRAADGAVTMTAVAKMLEVKRPWLFDTMTEAGWFYVQNGTHLPYAPLLARGYLTMGPAKKDPILRTDGRAQIVAATLVTAKGVDAITKIVRHKLDTREMTIKLAKAIMKIKAEGDAREAEEDRAILDKLNHDDRIYGSGD